MYVSSYKNNMLHIVAHTDDRILYQSFQIFCCNWFINTSNYNIFLAIYGQPSLNIITMLRYLRVRKTMTMKLYFPFGIIASYLRETLKPFFDLSCISAVNTPLCNNSKTCWCIQQLYIITWNYYRLLVIKNM